MADLDTSKMHDEGVTETPEAATKAINPALLQKLTESRTRLLVTLAQVTLAMVSSPRYRHLSIGELQNLLIDPLLRDRVAVATAGPKKDAPPSLNDGQVVGVAIWAKVSAEVDAKIREQIKAGTFPVRLKSEDWASGEIAWLLDVIAPTRQQATAVLTNIQQVAKGGNLLVHPIVRNLVAPELLQKAAQSAAVAEAEGQTTH